MSEARVVRRTASACSSGVPAVVRQQRTHPPLDALGQPGRRPEGVELEETLALKQVGKRNPPESRKYSRCFAVPNPWVEARARPGIQMWGNAAAPAAAMEAVFKKPRRPRRRRELLCLLIVESLLVEEAFCAGGEGETHRSGEILRGAWFGGACVGVSGRALELCRGGLSAKEHARLFGDDVQRDPLLGRAAGVVRAAGSL